MVERGPIVCVLLLMLNAVHRAVASGGDHSWIFQRCARACLNYNCSRIADAIFATKQPVHMRVLHWTCPNECEYMCMWETVDAYQRDGSPVPQFYGKWPFIRLLGIQEPASVIFSILNGLAHFIMLLKFRREVKSSAPLYWIWHLHAVIAINAWFWSVVFHTRDNDFTEQMDYFCAISLVLYSFFVVWARFLGTKNPIRPLAVFAVLLAYFIYHVHYLAFVYFDYGYNMKANVTVGILNSLGWISWSIWHRKRQPYVWKAIVTILSVNTLLSLELGDFPPIWWTFDAHSLWHAGTAPVTLLWYSFIIDDSKYVLQEQEETEEAKKV